MAGEDRLNRFDPSPFGNQLDGLEGEFKRRLEELGRKDLADRSGSYPVDARQLLSPVELPLGRPIEEMPLDELQRRVDDAAMTALGFAMNGCRPDEIDAMMAETFPNLKAMRAELARRSKKNR